MKVYIGGPISGRADQNLPAFRSAATRLSNRGHQPVVPHDIPAFHPQPGDCPPSYTRGPDHSAACYLRGDALELLQCDAVYMLVGWEASVGARFEHWIASHCGIPISYEQEEFAG